MIKSLHPLKVFINSAEHYFSEQDTCTSTLSSCVSIALWHSQLRVEGMPHSMLPKVRSVHRGGIRSVDEAVAAGESYKEYRITLLGGGNIFPENKMPSIDTVNVQVGRRLINHHRFLCMDEHSRGNAGYLDVTFEVWSGEVWLKHGGTKPCMAYRRRR